MSFNTRPDISIIMANYNKGQYISAAIKSVIGQFYDNWELVIIDDASSDNSLETIKSFSGDKRIKFFQNEKNLGYTRTLKLLIDKAKAPIVGILDSDDALDKNALGEVMSVYDKHPGCGLAYTQHYRCDANLKPLEQGHSRLLPPNETNLRLNVVHAFRTFKKEQYLRTLGYDNEMIFAEDIDLMLKLEEVTKFYFIDKPLYYYRILPHSQTHSYKNEMINRSSTALAKLNAFERRQGTDIPNHSKTEFSEVLFFGVFTSLLAKRWNLTKQFLGKLIKNNPFFFLQPGFYSLIFEKTLKIFKLKINQPTLRKADRDLT